MACAPSFPPGEWTQRRDCHGAWGAPGAWSLSARSSFLLRPWPVGLQVPLAVGIPFSHAATGRIPGRA
eukprot:3484806-Heterocapsa_arctica.AAC.1